MPPISRYRLSENFQRSRIITLYTNNKAKLSGTAGPLYKYLLTFELNDLLIYSEYLSPFLKMNAKYKVIIGGFIAQFFSIGFFTYSASLFFPFIISELNSDITEIMLGPTFATILGLVAMPIAGILLDRYSVRLMMLLGGIFFAAGIWSLANISNVTQFVFVFGFTMSVANCLVGSMSTSTLISRWFTKSRGRALGASAVGTSIGGIVLPATFGFLITSLGWRTTLELFSVSILFLLLPILYLMIRDDPSSLRGELDSSAADYRTNSGSESNQMTTRDYVINPNFWYLGLSLGILFSGYSAVLANITPYAIHLGFETGDAALFIMMIAINGLLGKVLFGFAADRFSLRGCLIVTQFLVLFGFAILATLPSFYFICLACVILGLSTGGMLPIWGALMAKLFGLKNYGRATGLMSPIITICVIPGYSVMGFFYLKSGDYQLSLSLFSVTLIFAIALLIPLKVKSNL